MGDILSFFLSNVEKNMCGRKRFKFEVERIVTGRGLCIEVREKACNFWRIGQVFSSLSP